MYIVGATGAADGKICNLLAFQARSSIEDKVIGVDADEQCRTVPYWWSNSVGLGGCAS
jgi:hypothetical protein